MPLGMWSAAPASSTREPSGRSLSRLRLRSPAPMPQGARSCHRWTSFRPETTISTESVSSRCVPESVAPTLQKTCVDGVWRDGDRPREDAGTDLHVPVRGVGQAPAVRAADSSSWHRSEPSANLCGNQVSRAPRHRRDVTANLTHWLISTRVPTASTASLAPASPLSRGTASRTSSPAARPSRS